MNAGMRYPGPRKTETRPTFPNKVSAPNTIPGISYVYQLKIHFFSYYKRCCYPARHRLMLIVI